MVIVSLDGYGDFDVHQTDSIMIGEGPVPNLEDGMLKTDVIRELKAYGFSFPKKKNNVSLTFTDDYYCNNEDPKKRKDTRLRLQNN